MKELNTALVQVTGKESYAQASGEIQGVRGKQESVCWGGKYIGLVINSHGSKKKWVGDEWRWLGDSTVSEVHAW